LYNRARTKTHACTRLLMHASAHTCKLSYNQVFTPCARTHTTYTHARTHVDEVFTSGSWIYT